MRSIILFVLLLTLGCSTKKNIIYLNDDTDYNLNFDYVDHIIQKDDILKITVSNNAMLNEIKIYDEKVNQVSSKDILKLYSYTVNNEGYIDYPTIGKIKLSGLTIYDAQDLIYKLLLEKGQLTNHSILISLLNFNFTILGEVNKPGYYEHVGNNLSIMECIGLAGDLTINGRRDNIKLLRKFKNETKIYNIDMTSNKTINSDLFQIKSRDVIIVNPNSSRIKNAGIIGNSGTLLSLLSFILSSIIVISN